VQALFAHGREQLFRGQVWRALPPGVGAEATVPAR
jgi:hypothetical protein